MATGESLDSRSPTGWGPDRMPKPSMNENQRRGIATTLRLLDEALCRFEEWAQGRERHSVLYHEHNDLSPEQRRRLLEVTARFRRCIERMRDDLDLEPSLQTASSDIWGTCSGFWENLVELESRHLRRYGEVSPSLARYVDKAAPELVHHLEDVLVVLAGRKRTPPDASPRSNGSEEGCDHETPSGRE